MEDNQKSGAAVQAAPECAAQSAPKMQETREQAPAAKKPQEAPALRKAKRTPVYTIAICLYYIVAKVFHFMRFEGMENIPKDKNCIIMGNHQHIFDPLILALCARDREIHFMGKKELWNNKIVGWFFTKAHGFPVDRGNMDMTAIRTAMGILKDGDTLGIFPEGTRTKGPQMGPLLSGSAMLALRSGCPVIPVYIDGDYKLFRPMVVRVGKPVEMDDLRAGRITKDSFDVLTARVEESFFALSGGKSRAAQAD